MLRLVSLPSLLFHFSFAWRAQGGRISRLDAGWLARTRSRASREGQRWTLLHRVLLGSSFSKIKNQQGKKIVSIIQLSLEFHKLQLFIQVRVRKENLINSKTIPTGSHM